MSSGENAGSRGWGPVLKKELQGTGNKYHREPQRSGCWGLKQGTELHAWQVAGNSERPSDRLSGPQVRRQRPETGGIQSGLLGEVWQEKTRTSISARVMGGATVCFMTRNISAPLQAKGKKLMKSKRLMIHNKVRITAEATSLTVWDNIILDLHSASQFAKHFHITSLPYSLHNPVRQVRLELLLNFTGGNWDWERLVTAQGSLGEKALGWKLKPWLYLFLCFESKFFFFSGFWGPQLPHQENELLGLPKSSFGFFHKMLRKNQHEHFGQPNTICPRLRWWSDKCTQRSWHCAWRKAGTPSMTATLCQGAWLNAAN